MAAGEYAFLARKFRLDILERVDRDGNPFYHEVIRHPGAAVVLPLLDEETVILIEQRRSAINARLLELPAGTLDAGESPETCATRELAEETGYRARRFTPLLSFYSAPGFTDEHLHAFLATELQPGESACEPQEDIRVVPMKLSAVRAAIAERRIVDAKTLVTLLFYGLIRQGSTWTF